MINKADEIIELFGKHLRGELSEGEKGALDEFLGGSKELRELFKKINSGKEFSNRIRGYYGKANSISDEDIERAFAKSIEPEDAVPVSKRKASYFKWMMAASILLALSLLYFGLFNNKNSRKETIVRTNEAKNDVAPGRYKAKLTLDDGRSIILDTAATGELTRQGNALISNQDGQLLYTNQASSPTTKILHNTLSTGRGETYPTVLSDGSRVYLNNETSLRFPVIFSGSERRVELIGGEAYFEIVHNSAVPFKVVLHGTEIEVLGTQFAVMAYPGEKQIRTSLLTGKVKVSSLKAGSSILAPGEMANVDTEGNISVVKGADVEGSIAWVRGMFHFEEADLQSVLRQFARWYDVDIEYSGRISNDKIEGDLERNIPLSRVLKNLEKLGTTKFTIENRKIIVNPR